MKLYVATHNAHKIREISQILPGLDIAADDPEGVSEDAPDFIGNAFIKVRAIASRHPGAWCMADDSGLEVRALCGAPGVRSARYAGEPSDTQANNALLLRNMDGVEDRAANFTCAVALVDPEGREHSAVGKCFGRIASAPSGAEGFGYDPLFIPDGHERSFAELSADEKNAISHRGRALAEVKKILEGGVRRERGGASRANAWLRFFRVVNLPTVPGDIFVGAAAALAAGAAASARGLAPVWPAALAGVFMYMFGLADNDIVGAKTDRGRPVADGEISPAAARVARSLCIAAAAGAAVAADLPRAWWWTAFALAVAVVVYNRTKSAVAMGACRALNVACGAACVLAAPGPDVLRGLWPAAAAAGVWLVYIGAVTKYSEGEESDSAKRRRVGLLVGGVVYLQILALVALVLAFPSGRALTPLLAAGAAMLVALRLLRTLFPRVSAS